MPIPNETTQRAALQTAVEAADQQADGRFDPAQPRQLYKDQLALWQLYLDLAELDGNKLAAMVEKHHANELGAKYQLRQRLAVAYNLVPLIVGMIGSYLFGEAPQIDVGGDEQLQAFVDDCDGNGRSLENYLRETAVPLSVLLGFVDVLVQNPPAPEAAPVVTKAQAAKLLPRVYTVPATVRLNWACDTNDAYKWVRFKDASHDDGNPFLTDPATEPVYFTIGRGGEVQGVSNAYWIRSVQAENNAGEYVHTFGVLPTARVPMATLYNQRSNDPGQRHLGISKIAMIALLTRQIVQILSWATEDILANLALYCFPSKNGVKPVDPATGKDKTISEFSAFTVLWFDKEAGHAPMVLQGDVGHIEIKLKLIGMHLQEILRLANLLSVSAQASTSGAGAGGSGGGSASGSKSGTAGMVERSELHRELKERAAAADEFTMELLALAKGAASNSDVSVQDLAKAKVSVQFSKGPYSIEPLADVLTNTEQAVAMFREFSPTLVTGMLKQTARTALYGDGITLTEALKEIDSNTAKVIDRDASTDADLRQAEVDAAKAAAAAPAREAA